MHHDRAIYLPRWSRTVLVAAGFYNVLWGTLVVFAPDLIWVKLGINPPLSLQLWQFIGLTVVGFGLGYFFSSLDPVRYWPFIFIGFLGKLIVPFGFLFAWSAGTLPFELGWTILFSDVIWWIPLGLILYAIHQQFVLESRPLEEEAMLEEDFQNVKTNTGWKLVELSNRHPVILIFLRHFGCPFCREAITELAQYRKTMEGEDKKLVVVHMSSPEEAQAFLAEYGLPAVHHISDPDRKMYRYFGLRRGFVHQVLGFKVLLRFLQAGLVKGHGLDAFYGDYWQMPGVFLYYKGKIRKKFIHRTVADRPDYEEFIQTKAATQP